MTESEPTIVLKLDPTNPGQFFACCGLFELASRHWPGVVDAWFDRNGRRFHIRVKSTSPRSLLLLRSALRSCTLSNSMTAEQLLRRSELSSIPKKGIEGASLKEEESRLASVWRESPVVLGPPFNLKIDWPHDTRAGGSTLKTWAGQQSVIDIALSMRAQFAEAADSLSDDAWLVMTSRGGGLPFNFDSDLGGQGAPLDVGFSFDPLPSMKVGVRPVVEFCAFVGLQRFRPSREGKENRYSYSTWGEPLLPSTAAVAACGHLSLPGDRRFEFRLLYRTKYLKSFLSAKPT